MRRPVASLLFLALLIPAASYAGPGGINLAWTDCGSFGIFARNFACDTNAGSSALFGSFIAPVPVGQLDAIEAVIDLQSLAVSLPNYWQLASGGCRFGALSSTFNFLTGPFSCGDPWQGLASGGLLYQPGVPTPTVARLLIASAVEVPVSIDDETEYYAFELKFSNAKAVGAGSCSGCLVPMCLVLKQIKLDQPAGVGDYVVQNPIVTNGASWQQYGANCPFQEVPTRATTWGAVKSLYH